ncbi:unnamed protein product [Mytilus coruscus]|uniref:Uncharacterized protein n=1 Tax=Mytilus coruscus TaxID=42192 RepID=A0A6J8D077_MYTCO|nr:unnamed protein product [Mytilus coruscus]
MHTTNITAVSKCYSCSVFSGTGSSKTKLKGELFETEIRKHYNIVTEQSTTDRENHTEKPINQTPRCKLAHDFTNQHNSRLIVRFGLENFKENQIKRVLNNHFPSICRDYNFHEKCKVGTKKCVNLHLCGSYKFGKCEEQCKYKRTHKLSKDHNKWVLRAFEMRSWPEDKILKSIYVPPKRVSSYQNNDKCDLDHYKYIDDDDDDLYKGSDFVPLKADSSDGNSDEDESDKLSIC